MPLPAIASAHALSILDAAMGGGRGVARAGDAISFGSHGQTLDVWRPSAVGGQALPVLIFWYGGGWISGDRRSYAFAARAYARAGFVVVMPDYRKVPETRFPGFIEDAAEAVRWTLDSIADFGGHPDRIALGGHSAGAYSAVMLALDPRWLRGAAVDPATVRAVAGLSGPYDFHPFTDSRAIDAMGNAPKPELTQPIRLARADAPPMLLVTSGADVQVGPHNAYNLADRLRCLGAPVELRDYPQLKHEHVVMALSVPFRTKAPVLADSVTFLKSRLT